MQNTEEFRQEHDFIGNRDIPNTAYYGVQTLRAMENFHISGVTMKNYPTIIRGLAEIKLACAKANYDLKLLTDEQIKAMETACNEVAAGKFDDQFPTDMFQGGAGTSTNMNANEVIANRALELMGHKKGEYKFCHPNDHVNLAQSTNDAYPCAMKLGLYYHSDKLVKALELIIKAFRNKAEEFKNVIKMGRTQLQDAVPMTLGQEFEVYAKTLEIELCKLKENAKELLVTNLGGTAIGTGINADPRFSDLAVKHLCDITKLDCKLADNLIEATPDTSEFVTFSSMLKRIAIKVSKTCNDLRLMGSGPRCGLLEINLPKMQPGSSIMPGKVNPVIPEVMNQACFKVIGNDLAVTMAAEAGQLELNVMEPVIVECLFQSVDLLSNGLNTLRTLCIDGITANEDRCREMVNNSIGIVTALNPILGYEKSAYLAKTALETGGSVYDLVLKEKFLTKAELDEALKPENMLAPKEMTMLK